MDTKKVLVRMPADLVGELDEAAREEHRSRTAEIVKRLEESFEKEAREQCDAA